NGVFDSTGTSSISNAAITIAATGILQSTGGTLTIDPSTIANAGLLEADGGERDLNDITSFTNSGTLLATADSLLVLNGDIIVSTGTVEVDHGSGSAHSTIDFERSIPTRRTPALNGVFDSTGTSSISDAAITIAATGILQSTGGVLTI